MPPLFPDQLFHSLGFHILLPPQHSFLFQIPDDTDHHDDHYDDSHHQKWRPWLFHKFIERFHLTPPRIGSYITLKVFQVPRFQRQISRPALMHQSRPMASAMPITPIPIHRPNTKESSVRHTTVANRDDHMANFTSPAARRPEDNGIAKGYTKAAKVLWMMTMTNTRCLVSAVIL